MPIEQYIKSLDPETRQIIAHLHELIISHDKAVEANIKSLMSVDMAIVYTEQEVFKYGLAVNKNHLSYHSMVMYLYPQLIAELKKVSPRIKWQKGCFNFKKLENIHEETFLQFLKKSAEVDFSPVILHYQKKKR